MFFRYFFFIFWMNIVGNPIAWVFYPAAYTFRSYWREHKDTYPQRIFWFMLNDEHDYGDPYFYEKHYRSDSEFQMFILSYKWAAWRNPNQNLYHTLIITGPQKVLESKVTCHREGVSEGNWRTLKYKDKNDVFKDKHGNYIDYGNSILGKQWYVFEMNGKKYFRYSFTDIKYIKWLNKIFVREYKFGFENTNWAGQFRHGLKPADKKSLSEYYEFKTLEKKLNLKK